MGLRYLTAGESHGPTQVAILDGFPAGMSLSTADINPDLARRQRGFGSSPRMKLERDSVNILSGVLEGFTNGAPLALQIINSDHAKWRNVIIPPFTVPRPGHADLVGAIKFGHTDLRLTSERASARETVARVAVGAVCRKLLAQFDICVAGWVGSIGTTDADISELLITDCIRQAAESDVNCPDPSASKVMQSAIDSARSKGDTLGGVIEVVVLGAPPGLGSFSQWDRRLDALLGAAVLSIPGIKGVEVGDAFANARRSGTQANDAIVLQPNGVLSRPTNHAGGIEGGVSNGEPIHLRVAMKPIPSTLTPQTSVDLASGKPRQTIYERSDTCPVPRAVAIVESMVTFTIANELINKIGGDSISEMLPRFISLRRTRLDDLHLDNKEHVFWPDDE